jgi:hypothetical protein
MVIALQKFLACIGKPKKITCGRFYRHNVLMIKIACGDRSVESWNVHRRFGVEMRDELVSVSTHPFREVRELRLLHSHAGQKVVFKGGRIHDDIAPEMLVSLVTEQLAPLKHGYVEKVATNLAPESRVRVGWNAGLRTRSALSRAKVGDIPGKTCTENYNSTETFTARQWLAPNG